MSTLLITIIPIIIISLFLNDVFAYQFYYYCYNITRNIEEHKHKYTKEKFGRDSVKVTIGNVITSDILRKNNGVNKAILYTGLVSNSGNILRNNCVNKEMGNEIVRLVGSLSSIIVGVSMELSEEEISSNVFNGQRLGKNAAENNAFGTTTISGCAICGPAGCSTEALMDTKIVVSAGVLSVYTDIVSQVN